MITGRMIVAVAVTVEIGKEKARILYRTMLQNILNKYDVDVELGFRRTRQ